MHEPSSHPDSGGSEPRGRRAAAAAAPLASAAPFPTGASRGERPDRRLVLLAYYFPPMGGAGTQRSAAFARHLPELGYEPVVVCGGELRPGPHTIAHDPTLLAGLSPTMAVTRVPAIERQRPARGDRWHPARLVVSARELAWARRAADAAVFAARRHDATAILVSASPWACGLAVRDLRRRSGRPVVLDLRDPWALDGWRAFRTPLHRRLDRALMRRSLRAADLVVANCPRAAAAYRALAGLPADRVVTIPNGFETAEFPARRRHVRTARPADPAAPFRIVHMGTLHDPDPRTARRGPFAGDRLAHHLRSGRTLLRAAGRLRRERPDLAERLRLVFHGQVHPGHETLAETEGIADLIEHHGYVDHDRVPEILSHADAILVPLHGVEPGAEALVVPGKLYEALASGRPVLGTLPAGDARRLVRLAGGDGRAFDPDDETGTAEALAQWLEAAAAGWRPEGAPRELLAPFSRRRLAERLARAIDALDGRGTMPADDPWMELAENVSRVDGGTAIATIAADETGGDAVGPGTADDRPRHAA